MKVIPVRLENAITKLYTAFHNGELESTDCSMCAVGNICNNESDWNEAVRTNISLMSPRRITDRNIREFMVNETILKSGYSVSELSDIELIFVTEALLKSGFETKETQFKGLCAVVEYLCELDNIPNVMEYTKLFETENEQPKYKLEEQLN